MAWISCLILNDKQSFSRLFNSNKHISYVSIDYHVAFTQTINHFTELNIVNYFNFHFCYHHKGTKFYPLIVNNVERPSKIYIVIIKIRYVSTLGRNMTYFLYMGQWRPSSILYCNQHTLNTCYNVNFQSLMKIGENILDSPVICLGIQCVRENSFPIIINL